MTVERAPEPVLSTLWWFPRWTNPDYTGAWEVVEVGRAGTGEYVDPVVVLQRCGGERQLHESALTYWPGGWEEWPDGD